MLINCFLFDEMKLIVIVDLIFVYAIAKKMFTLLQTQNLMISFIPNQMI